VELAHAQRLNAFNEKMWEAIHQCFHHVAQDSNVRVIILGAQGKVFTAGLDLKEASETFVLTEKDVARRALNIRDTIKRYQAAVNAIENCGKPVIAMIHGACVGAGVDLITACDIRYCSQDARFTVKEIDVGLAADVGVLQRLPKVVHNESWVREVCFTARWVEAKEALQQGLVSCVFKDKREMEETTIKIAQTIAAKSPIAVMGTKQILLHARDHSVTEGLEYVTTWNAAMLQTEDVVTAITTSMSKQKPLFGKL